MADSSFRPASFWTQANALLRKNLTFQVQGIGICLVGSVSLFIYFLFLVSVVLNFEFLFSY